MRNGPLINSLDDIIVVIDEIFDNRLYDIGGIGPQANDRLIIDVGAHVGVFTLWARTRSSAKIIAFEPHPDNYQQLQKNVVANRMHDITVHDIAVSGESGTISLTINQSSSGNHTYKDSSNVSSVEASIAVKSTTLQ